MSFVLDPHEAEIVNEYREQVPVRVGALANALGVPVLRSTLHPGISGLIQPSQDTPSGFVIKVNRHEKKERQRFTIAHEIGHYCLHRKSIGRGIIDTVLYRSKLSSALEVEANKFAAFLVMPIDKIREANAELSHLPDKVRIDELANRFQVSADAMAIRLGLR